MKKIHRTLSGGESPIFLNESHEHLSTVDIRSGMIYHYYDPEEENLRKIIDVHKIKRLEMDKDVSMMAKKQFEKNFMATDREIDGISIFLKTISSGNEDALANLKDELEKAYENVYGKVAKAQISNHGTILFSHLFFCLGLMEKLVSKKINWFWLAKEDGLNVASSYLDEISINIIKNGLTIESIGYVVDSELFVRPVSLGEVDLDPGVCFQLNRDIFISMEFEMPAEDYQKLENWCKTSKNKV